MSSSALWRVRSYVRPYAAQMITMTLAALIGLGAATVVPLVTKAVIDGPIARHEHRGIVILAGLALGLGVIEAASAFLRRYVLADAATGMETALRDDLYAHLQRLPVTFHDGSQSGQLLSRAVSDIAVIRRFVGFGLVFLVVNTATFAAVLVLLLQLNVPLAILVAVSSIPVIASSRSFERDYRAASRKLQDETGNLTTVVEEAATGIRIIKSFGRHPLVGTRFRSSARVVYDRSMDQVRLKGRFFAILGLAPNLTLAAVLLGGGMAVGRGTMTIGGLVAFVSLLLMLSWPIEALGEILAMGEEAASAAERIYEVLDTEPEISDRPGAQPLPHATGRLQFRGVTFAYPGSQQEILHGIDLDVEPGETLALVGRTGCGKTTLVSLVPRLYDVTSGSIELDGHDIRDLTLDSLRGHLGVAFEDPILFSASVRETLLLGYPDASDDEVASALDTAQANFVYDLPWGLDTRVGEQGLSLSGGQRQRLALARAVVGRPRVLILDDPLSSLDVHTEALVEEALSRVLAGTTALLAVHRPSTLALADRVAFIDGGTVAAVGTHSHLLDTVPEYREILSQEAEEVSR
ncbi:MAG: ATP-binding cassette, subfamily bacterial [Actinomycetota bacterium]|nr:ATP-binding cassette, subfamily bacterial [Actinomycetota bacterium]